jgi:hypothetical protein
LWVLTHVAPQHVKPLPHAGLQEPPELPPDDVLDDAVPDELADEAPPEELLVVVPSADASPAGAVVVPPHCTRLAAKPRAPNARWIA